MRVHRVVFIVLAVLAASRGASAQTDAPLARFISDLIAAGGRIDGVASVELGDFLIAQQLGGIPSQLNQSLGFQLATVPFDMGLDPTRPGYEFGQVPSFAVRAGTSGRGKTSVSFNYQNVSYGWIDGIPLKEFGMGFVLRPPAGTQARFGRDVVHQSLALRMQHSVATFGVVYGATERLEIGVGVPMMHLEMEGQVQARVFGLVTSLPTRPPCPAGDRFCNPNIPPDAHFFDVYPSSPLQADGCKSSAVEIDGVDHAPGEVALFNMVQLASRTVTRKCKASGIGDIAGHIGYRISSSESNALAVMVDARLPTGDPDNLLGSGGTRITGGVVWRGHSGRFLPRFAVGYTYGIGESSALFNTVTSCVASNPAAPATRATTCSVITSPTPLDLKLPAELNFAGGTDIVFRRRLTVGGDLFVRRVDNLATFAVNPSTAPALQPGDPQVPGNLLQVKGFGATLMVAAATAQVALTDRTVIKMNGLIPMAGQGDGLTARMSFGFGLGLRY
jgi:hypothetical protein